MAFPRRINLGSGKDFRPDMLNVDVSPYWSPDVLADICGDFPADGRVRVETRRFGVIDIELGSFDELTAIDVLEHLPDLPRAMTNCLALLREGGVFHIQVPYDLSYGAWQDPSHVRAFNERSWIYFTDWFWYLGWQTHRFELTKLAFALSPLGVELKRAGKPDAVIARMPRAVDAMHVTLTKIPLSEKDRNVLAELERRRETAARPSP